MKLKLENTDNKIDKSHLNKALAPDKHKGALKLGGWNIFDCANWRISAYLAVFMGGYQYVQETKIILKKIISFVNNKIKTWHCLCQA